MHRHVVLAAVTLSLLAGSGADAQTADLRYVAPLPSAVTFTTTDSVSNTIMGMPPGPMTTSGAMHGISRVRFVPTDSGLSISINLVELTGSMSTPMGDVPLEVGESEAVSLMLDERGPDEAALLAAMGARPTGGSPENQFGPQRGLSGLVRVPGRSLRAGETWTDSMTISTDVEEMKVEGVMKLRGTYAGDTIVDGLTLNVLRIESEMTSTTSGTTEGMQVKQDLASTGQGTILWDSSRHIPLRSDITADIRANTNMPAAGMSFDMTIRTRSITTAQPES